MSFDWTAIVIAVVPTGATSAITDAYAMWQERQREARATPRDAAADLLVSPGSALPEP